MDAQSRRFSSELRKSYQERRPQAQKDESHRDSLRLPAIPHSQIPELCFAEGLSRRSVSASSTNCQVFVLRVVHIREAQSYLLLSGTQEKELLGLQVTSQPKKVTFVTLLADETIHPRYEEALKHVERDFGKHHPMFINGRQVLAGGEFEVHSPVDSSILLGYI